MNYIYDIVLNFNKEYYNFFEWNKRDNIVKKYHGFPDIICKSGKKQQTDQEQWNHTK